MQLMFAVWALKNISLKLRVHCSFKRGHQKRQSFNIHGHSLFVFSFSFSCLALFVQLHWPSRVSFELFQAANDFINKSTLRETGNFNTVLPSSHLYTLNQHQKKEQCLAIVVAARAALHVYCLSYFIQTTSSLQCMALLNGTKSVITVITWHCVFAELLLFYIKTINAFLLSHQPL